MKAREAYIEQMPELDPTKLVFLDESGFKTNLTRRYGWAPSGERPMITASRYGKNVTIIGAIALDGLRACRAIDAKFDGPAFIDFLDTSLGPTLHPGDIVVMDGPRLHRVDGVQQALEKWAPPLCTSRVLPRVEPDRDVLVVDEGLGARAGSVAPAPPPRGRGRGLGPTDPRPLRGLDPPFRLRRHRRLDVSARWCTSSGEQPGLL